MIRAGTLTSAVLVVTWLSGCVGSADDAEVAAIQAAIEEENGGYQELDEMPLFDAPELFVESGLDAEDAAVEEPELAYGPEAMEIDYDARDAVNVLVLWGQMPLDREGPRPVRWDGAISTTTGAIIVRRTVRFEGRTDFLQPRPDRQTVPFHSATAPHNDGMLLTVVTRAGDDDPTAAAGDLVIESAALAEPVVIAHDELAGLRRVIDVDDQGNRMLIVGLGAETPCADGFYGGVWRRLRPGLGTFHGRWTTPGGALDGHVRGVWGVTRAGEHVFFGKYIDPDGGFRGILRGTWQDGELRGQWVGRGGELRGTLGGRYTDAPDRVRVDGFMAGGWSESCDGAPDEAP